VPFASGLNVLTGETGAGKSILVDAILLVLGARAHPDLIRSGEDLATVQAVFDVDGGGPWPPCSTRPVTPRARASSS
jgi:DNA repair protein RecN (Recombination protein N)